MGDISIGSSPEQAWFLYDFSWVEPGRICASACPEFLENVSFLKTEGVGHIVTLSRDYLPPAGTTEMGLHCHLIDIPEFSPPNKEQIANFISICEWSHSTGMAVCVHCRQGLGRTGTMLACYLVKYCNKKPQEAIAQVRHLRPGSIETSEQEWSVVKYYMDAIADQNIFKTHFPPLNDEQRTFAPERQAGVTCSVPNPPPDAFSWVETGRICASAWPKFLNNVAFLKSEGVGHIVTLSRWCLPPKGTTEMGLQCHLIDMPPGSAPNMAQIANFISICNWSRSTGMSVCVHCNLGRGRTGTMLACYLVKYCNKTPQEAIAEIRQLRPDSIETQEQEDAVKTYFEYISQVPQTNKCTGGTISKPDI